jgi:large subunit ribosomal protein L1
MPKHGKKYRAVLEKVDRLKLYTLDEATKLVLETGVGKFDESVDVAVKLGVNPRHADQMVRGACVLPHGTGKTVRVVVFAKGDKVREAEEAGADRVGGDDLVEDIRKGWLDFDKAVATPDMMGSVGKIGRILGPRGLMPNPKVGTVTFDVGTAVREAKAGKIEFRVDKAGIIHAPVGKRSFASDKIRENIVALVDVLQRLKPSTAKGHYIRGVALSTTMGPGIKLDSSDVQNALKGV